eukprot:GDKJ01022934.1.p1 GENE.GDKJ01022934.1~~GDKJ01022934.1.p1  ORF type:complete len:1096 (-),score=228.85 GDKJ01022934.1:37-3324(-)
MWSLVIFDQHLIDEDEDSVLVEVAEDGGVVDRLKLICLGSSSVLSSLVGSNDAFFSAENDKNKIKIGYSLRTADIVVCIFGNSRNEMRFSSKAFLKSMIDFIILFIQNVFGQEICSQLFRDTNKQKILKTICLSVLKMTSLVLSDNLISGYSRTYAQFSSIFHYFGLRRILTLSERDSNRFINSGEEGKTQSDDSNTDFLNPFLTKVSELQDWLSVNASLLPPTLTKFPLFQSIFDSNSKVFDFGFILIEQGVVFTTNLCQKSVLQIFPHYLLHKFSNFSLLCVIGSQTGGGESISQSLGCLKASISLSEEAAKLPLSQGEKNEKLEIFLHFTHLSSSNRTLILVLPPSKLQNEQKKLSKEPELFSMQNHFSPLLLRQLRLAVRCSNPRWDLISDLMSKSIIFNSDSDFIDSSARRGHTFASPHDEMVFAESKKMFYNEKTPHLSDKKSPSGRETLQKKNEATTVQRKRSSDGEDVNNNSKSISSMPQIPASQYNSKQNVIVSSKNKGTPSAALKISDSKKNVWKWFNFSTSENSKKSSNTPNDIPTSKSVMQSTVPSARRKRRVPLSAILRIFDDFIGQLSHDRSAQQVNHHAASHGADSRVSAPHGATEGDDQPMRLLFGVGCDVSDQQQRACRDATQRKAFLASYSMSPVVSLVSCGLVSPSAVRKILREHGCRVSKVSRGLTMRFIDKAHISLLMEWVSAVMDDVSFLSAEGKGRAVSGPQSLPVKKGDEWLATDQGWRGVNVQGSANRVKIFEDVDAEDKEKENGEIAMSDAVDRQGDWFYRSDDVGEESGLRLIQFDAWGGERAERSAEREKVSFSRDVRDCVEVSESENGELYSEQSDLSECGDSLGSREREEDDGGDSSSSWDGDDGHESSAEGSEEEDFGFCLHRSINGAKEDDANPFKMMQKWVGLDSERDGAKKLRKNAARLTKLNFVDRRRVINPEMRVMNPVARKKAADGEHSILIDRFLQNAFNIETHDKDRRILEHNTLDEDSKFCLKGEEGSNRFVKDFGLSNEDFDLFERMFQADNKPLGLEDESESRATEVDREAQIEKCFKSANFILQSEFGGGNKTRVQEVVDENINYASVLFAR